MSTPYIKNNFSDPSGKSDRTVGQALFDVLDITIEEHTGAAKLELAGCRLVAHVVALVRPLELNFARRGKRETLRCCFFSL